MNAIEYYTQSIKPGFVIRRKNDDLKLVKMMDQWNGHYTNEHCVFNVHEGRISHISEYLSYDLSIDEFLKDWDIFEPMKDMNMTKHTKKYGVYHWDTFDDITFLKFETDSLLEASNFIITHYGDRVSHDGADAVEVVDNNGKIIARYNTK